MARRGRRQIPGLQTRLLTFISYATCLLMVAGCEGREATRNRSQPRAVVGTDMDTKECAEDKPDEDNDQVEEVEEESELVFDEVEEVDEEIAELFEMEEALSSPARPKPEGISDGPWYAGGFEMLGCKEAKFGKEKLSFRVLGLSRYRRLETTRMVSGPPGSILELCMPTPLQEHTLSKPLAADEELYFALTFPYPLGQQPKSRIYSHLDSVLQSLVRAGAYVHRENLATSLGGHPIELVTMTRRSHRSAQRQPPLPDLTQEEAQRPWIFPRRRAIFVSARVHPGETPASFMLEGLLDFLASAGPEATELLRQYVVHLVPVLNPDGVAFGHHRLDMRAENLNRVYGKATLEHHPSIVAAQKACLCAHEHQGGLRLYLDLHAHSNRRGAFLLADAGRDAEARLFGWALGRCCNIFEYSQSDFSESKRGTGKSTIAKMTGNPLCFTVECHYIRGLTSRRATGMLYDISYVNAVV
ncbi:agbl5 [Symbiodinium natans]|uniref:Agbl5 protein n=1 Tax=Symbiodinium natans TaxID=878477 RepID=A0A812VCQ3_9DINO|nr:agbl5 [Symbiodinium natans]